MEELGGRGRRRVIVHLDLDCFYAQVEQRRLGIPAGEPVAVQQWGSLLAVNYVARKFGVKRSPLGFCSMTCVALGLTLVVMARAGEYIGDAKKKCPSIHLVRRMRFAARTLEANPT